MLSITDNQLQTFADLHNVELIFLVSGDPECLSMGDDYYTNSSFCYGDVILIGLYDDQELKVISFFHELGHILDPDRPHVNKYEMEAVAWKIGIEKAKEYNILFSPETLEWADVQLETYNKPEHL